MSWLFSKFKGFVNKPLKLSTADTILYKRGVTMPASPYASQSEIADFVWKIFRKEDIKVDLQSGRVGNQEGLGWMDRLDQKIARLDTQAKAGEQRIDELEKESKAGKEEFARLRKDRDEAKERLDAQEMESYLDRATEIEKHADFLPEEGVLARSERNVLTHGGNVLRDLKIVGIMQTSWPSRYHSIQSGFENWYEIPLAYEDQINNAPEEIIKALTTLVDAKSLYVWHKDRTAQKDSMEICRRIIRTWRNYIDTPGSEYPEDDINREYDELVKAGGNKIR